MSGAIKDLTSETSDLSTATDKLSSNYNTLSSNYNTVEGKVNNKVLINVDGKDVSAETLKIYRVDDDTYYDKVIKGHALTNELYIVSSDFINAYGEKLKNLASPTDDNDATTKKYVDDQITAVSQEIAEVNDDLKELSTYTHALSVSQLVWDLVIDCGSASSD